MARPIGYYVHHQGDGHRQRALAIAEAARGRITLIGTGLAGRTGTVPAIDLPDDRPLLAGGQDTHPCPQALHYAPIDHDGVRRRVAAVAGWIAEARPALIVVDVSVEIAMLARLASVPTVYVRLSGHRGDPAHLEAFRGATALMAPFHQDLEDDQTSHAIRHKTFYVPGLSKRPIATTVDEKVVLVVIGKGGAAGDGEAVAVAARATPDSMWRVIGPCSAPHRPPPNLQIYGWVDDPNAMIAGASVVIGAAGDGLVGSIIAARRPFVCIPEERPFDEQMSKAARLSALGAAVICPRWPDGADWPSLLAEARSLDPRVLDRLDTSDGSRRGAQWLSMVADGAGIGKRGAA